MCAGRRVFARKQLYVIRNIIPVTETSLQIAQSRSDACLRAGRSVVHDDGNANQLKKRTNERGRMSKKGGAFRLGGMLLAHTINPSVGSLNRMYSMEHYINKALFIAP